MSAILIHGLRKNIGFCELECEIRPISPRCNTWGRRRKPCGIKTSIAEDMERLRLEFGIEVDRAALLNESKERERARRKRQAHSRARIKEEDKARAQVIANG